MLNGSPKKFRFQFECPSNNWSRGAREAKMYISYLSKQSRWQVTILYMFYMISFRLKEFIAVFLFFFLCSIINDEELLLILDLPILVILDEAYIEFSGMNSRMNWVKKHENLIVLRTFSKRAGENLIWLRIFCNSFLATTWLY